MGGLEEMLGGLNADAHWGCVQSLEDLVILILFFQGFRGGAVVTHVVLLAFLSATPHIVSSH